MIRLIIVAAACIGLILLVTFFASRLVRSRRRGMSVRLQIFIALAAIVGGFAFGLGLMVIDRIEARAHRFATLAATEQATLMANLISAQLEARPGTLEDIAAKLREQDALEGVQLFTEDGQVFGEPMAGQTPGEMTVAAEAPILAEGRQRGRVRVTKMTIAIERLLRDFAPTVLVISLVLGAAAALAAGWIGQTIAQPIMALTQFSEQVAAGQSGAAVPAHAHGREVGRLSLALDSMRRQLEGRPFVETFAADLSHELKNPVAAIRASAEVLEDSALEEPEEARKFVRRIGESTQRIERLLSELLSLARIEARGVEQFEPLDVSRLVKTAAMSSNHPEKLELDIEPDVRVRADEHWLLRAIGNLLDNALIHGQGAVEVCVRQANDQALVEVSNDGAIARHTRDRIFRRFVTTRGDKGGTGLGLAIVRAVAEAHRGHIDLVQAGPQRVVFRLALPSA
jgi:signal transduction histidine kinase